MRVKSERACPSGGWIHRLLGESVRRAPYTKPPESGPITKIDAEALAVRYRNDLSPGKLAELSVTLGVSRNALTVLGVGWDGEAWTFPMVDGGRFVIGIQRRFPNGKKLCVTGSHLGCFVPFGVPGEMSELVVIVEGASDCAAVLDAGFDCIGRPSCTGGVEIVKAIIGSRLDVVILRDFDAPGIDGAERLAAALWHPGRLVKVIDPLRGKDARAWRPTHGELQTVTDNAYFWRKS
jgi:hypothetical protein